MTHFRHSIVIPVFNEEQGLRELHSRLGSALSQPLAACDEEWEVLFVDDGSRDQSATILRELRSDDPDHVRWIRFSRNFGHQAAITAGIDHATGDTVTIMDADLQDPPEVILEMIARWRSGVDVVYGVRIGRRGETLFKKTTAAIFYRLLHWSTELDMPEGAGDFRLMSRRAVLALRGLRERHRYLRGMSRWIGFEQAAVSYVRDARHAGATKYPLRRMVRLSWDAITSFSVLPLELATGVGAFSIALGLLAALGALGAPALSHAASRGWLVVLAVVLFVGGVQLLCLGVLGQYVGRILEESKRRPLYIIESMAGIAAPVSSERSTNSTSAEEKI